ncbi:sorting nexin-13-like [Ischnura elegans]|uniref:sorting nexin-13-like n=1 Tax=Ischnura elegans TaxID=197161 RepID=UPI001ED8BE2F|nr:sorting nexin-13-like [Ischnura elegans]
MSPSLLGWSGLIFVLCVSTFGVWWCVTVTLSVIVVVVGGLVYLYVSHAETAQKYYINVYRSRFELPRNRPFEESKDFGISKESQKVDRRLTGSTVIDDSLQEILAYVFRDYIYPWYERISPNEEFPKEIRQVARTVVVEFASRMKEVDWVKYLTTWLVNDAASHLRLFRQARARLKAERNMASQAASQQSSSQLFTPAPGTSGGPSPQASPNPPQANQGPVPVVTASAANDLEGAFFDLELEMEKDLCRDTVCTGGKEFEEQYIRDIVEVLLYLLVPAEDFHCKPLRFLFREIVANALLVPLLHMVSDPDYINRTIVWLCSNIPFTSDAFLTAIRTTDCVGELHATREMVSKEVAILRSRDSGGDDDIIVKQQLSSLLYMKKVIETRLHRLQEGLETDSAGLPTSLDWNHLIAPGSKLFSLPLDLVLKDNVALSYFIDYMTSIGAQTYLYFYLNVEGWRVSAEQQMSDLELQKIKSSIEQSDITLQSSTDTLQVPTSKVQPYQSHPQGHVLENMREAALSIYDQYLSEKASPRLRFDEAVVRRLAQQLRSECPSETWFDEIQSLAYEKLQTDERFLPSFRRSASYIRLLAELDLLKEPSRSDEEDDSQSLEDEASASSLSGGDAASVSSLDVASAPSTETTHHNHRRQGSAGSIPTSSISSSLPHRAMAPNHRRQGSGGSINYPLPISPLTFTQKSSTDSGASVSVPSVTPGETVTPGPTATVGNGVKPRLGRLKSGEVHHTSSEAPPLSNQSFILLAEIIETGVVNDRGKTYGIYAIHVTKRYESGHEEKWHVYRRYSDFYDLYQKIKDRFDDLAKLTFPGKRTFHNMERWVLERRMKMLNDYLQILLQAGVIDKHPSLRELLLAFFEQGDYDRGRSGVAPAVVRTLDNLVHPIRSSMRTVGNAVRSVPDNLLSTVDGMVDNISKVFSPSIGSIRQQQDAPLLLDSSKVGASLDVEAGDNIPLRVMLLLMDEVFDLQSRNQWLRRRIVTLLRQVVKAMFGDIVNRRIVDYIGWATSPDRVAEYLRAFKQSFWPNGCRAPPSEPRSEETRMRTRVAAKIALLSSLSDELKHIIGSETTRRGLSTVFDAFQCPSLNRRLCFALVEGFLTNLFPERTLPRVFQKLHSRSVRKAKQMPVKTTPSVNPVGGFETRAQTERPSMPSTSTQPSRLLRQLQAQGRRR